MGIGGPLTASRAADLDPDVALNAVEDEALNVN
jgi:hypothetical protein